MKVKSRLLIIVIIFGASIFLAFLKFGGTNHFKTLPYYGVDTILTKTVDGVEVNDTVFHQIPPFKFLSQTGKYITNEDVKGHVYVADFIFTNCGIYCPMMTSNMTRVQEAYRSNPDVKILSHTVDPERDSLDRLKAFADKYEAIPGKWYFITGEKEALYDIATKGYYAKKPEKIEGKPNEMVHEQKFILVDKEGYIRGFYNGMDEKDVDKLIEEIKLLLHEYEVEG